MINIPQSTQHSNEIDISAKDVSFSAGIVATTPVYIPIITANIISLGYVKFNSPNISRNYNSHIQFDIFNLYTQGSKIYNYKVNNKLSKIQH